MQTETHSDRGGQKERHKQTKPSEMSNEPLIPCIRFIFNFCLSASFQLVDLYCSQLEAVLIIIN